MKKGKQRKVAEDEEIPQLVEEDIKVHDEASVLEEQSPLRLNNPENPPENVLVAELREKLGQREQSRPPCDSPVEGNPLPDLTLQSDATVGVTLLESGDVPVESVKMQENAFQPLSLPVTIVDGPADLSMIAEGEEEYSSSLAKNTGKGNSQSRHDALDGILRAEGREAITLWDPKPKPDPDAASAVVALGDLISTPSIGISAPGPSGQVNTSAMIPVRQVRSSWLSKALGAGTIPISGLPSTTSDMTGLRKSPAPSSQRPNGPVDFAALRKSLAPAGVLKRKSDAGMDEEEEEDIRPEKMAKVGSIIKSIVNPLSESQSQSTIVLAALNGTPVSSTTLPHTDPSPILPEALMSLQHPRSDIHKVTKALDDLRERAQAKELAKQRSAPKATSTGSGFLRGLGNLGRSLGLGNSVKTAEEEAVRQEEERRAEVEAQEELARLIGEVSKPVQPIEAIPGMDAPHPAALVAPAQADEVEEDVEVEELEEEVEPQTIPEPPSMDVQPFQPDHPISPPHIDPQAVTSTTPADIPPRISTTPAGTPRHLRPMASVLHARQENHLYLSPATVADPSSEEPEQRVIVVQSPFHAPAAIVDQKPAHEDGRPSDSRSFIDRLSDTEDEVMEEEEVTEIQAKPVSEAIVNNFERLFAETDFISKAQHPLQSFASSSSLIPSHSLAASTSSQATSNGLLNQASLFAGKTLGFKPSTGPVKSLQVAAVAAKKVSDTQLAREKDIGSFLAGTGSERPESTHQRSCRTTQAASCETQSRRRAQSEDCGIRGEEAIESGARQETEGKG